MPGVVPVTDGRGVKLLEEQGEVALQRDLLQRLAVFDAESDPARFGFRAQPRQHFIGKLDVPLLFLLPLFDHFSADFFVFGRLLLAGADHLDQLVGILLHVDAAHVEHHQTRLQPLRHLQGLERVAPRILPLAAVQ